jgi:signal transduction histidine kinase
LGNFAALRALHLTSVQHKCMVEAYAQYQQWRRRWANEQRPVDRRSAASADRSISSAARRDLLAAVSHDLRTPLAAIRALMEAVVDGVAPDNAVQQRYLQSTQHKIVHLAQLVDDLFELSQIDAGMLQLHLERASLHNLLSDMIASLEPHAHQHGVHVVGGVHGAVLLVGALREYAV